MILSNKVTQFSEPVTSSKVLDALLKTRLDYDRCVTLTDGDGSHITVAFALISGSSEKGGG